MPVRDGFKRLLATDRKQIPSVTVADPEATTPVVPGETYVSVWLTNSFLKRDTRWLRKYFPAAEVRVTLEVAGTTRTLTRLARPAPGMVGRGVWAEFPITGPVPYNGGTIEIDAGLSALRRSSMLGAAFEVLDDFSGLVVPPISEALAVAEKVASGVQKLIDAGDGEVFLSVHHSYTSPGGGGNSELAPSYLAVVGADHEQLDPADLVVSDSSLHLRQGASTTPLDAFDYLLFRIEVQAERTDWEFPRIEALMADATRAYANGERKSYERYRDDAITTALNSPDLTRTDRLRVARAIRDDLNDRIAAGVGFSGHAEPSLATIIAKHPLPPALTQADLTLADLIEETV